MPVPERLRAQLPRLGALGYSRFLRATLADGLRLCPSTKELRFAAAYRDAARRDPPPPALDARARAWVVKEFTRLIDNGTLEARKERPRRVWPFFLKVEPAPKDFRLIYNLKKYNRGLRRRRFRMEGLRLIRDVARKGWYGASLDIKDMFPHVPLHPHTSNDFGIGPLPPPLPHYVVYRGMPFGLAHAPFWATQMLRPLVRRWRAAGIHLVVYMDDILVLAPTAAQTAHNRARIESDLRAAGWTPHPTKGVREPTQRLRFLGFIVDLAKGVIEAPDDKKVNIARVLQSHETRRGPHSGRSWASLIGSIMSLAPATENLALVMRPALHHHTWTTAEAVLRSTPAVDGALRAAVALIEQSQGRLIWPTGPTCVVETDMAGRVGWAGGIRGTNRRAKGDWTAAQMRCRDTGRLELLAVHRTLVALTPDLANHNLRLIGDNPKAQAYLRHGGGSDPICTRIVRDVATWAATNSVRILAPDTKRLYTGRDLSFADHWSRAIDATSWRTTEWLHEKLRTRWGKWEVDLFADVVNATAPTFYSRYAQPGSAGVDALAQHWPSGPLLFAAPPFALIPRALEQAERDHARVILLVPQWESAPWWPRACAASTDRWTVPDQQRAFECSPTSVPEPWLRNAKMCAMLLEPST